MGKSMISDNSSKHITAMENSKANSKKIARLRAVQRVLQRQTLTQVLPKFFQHTKN